MRDDFKEKLDRFKCLRCNECCRQPGFVYLRHDDADRIAGFLKMEARDFIDQFCDLEERRYLVLKKYPDEACIFLDENGCKIHPVKPGQCKDFPRKWRTRRSFDYCQGLKALI